MKRTKFLLIAVLLIASACTDGYIDEITQVQPGADESAPAITINYPLEGTLIRVVEDVTSIDIQFSATDDIEIANVILELNGTQIAEINEFKDYRRAVEEFTYDNLTNGEHTLTITVTDASGKSTSQSVSFEKVEPYRPIYDGEIFYMPFDGDNLELVTITAATREGNPGFTASGKVGGAYAGATDAYLTFPTSELTNPEFSAVFWYKMNAVPDRAALLVMGPPGDNNNNRTGGFRVFRENVGGNQRITLNVGNGKGDSWFNSADEYHMPPSFNDWIHVAFSMSDSECVLYINGEVAAQDPFTGVDWDECDVLSIASGAPRFIEWGHLSDLSNFDELRIFDKVLSQTEVQTIINNEQ